MGNGEIHPTHSFVQSPTALQEVMFGRLMCSKGGLQLDYNDDLRVVRGVVHQEARVGGCCSHYREMATKTSSAPSPSPWAPHCLIWDSPLEGFGLRPSCDDKLGRQLLPFTRCAAKAVCRFSSWCWWAFEASVLYFSSLGIQLQSTFTTDIAKGHSRAPLDEQKDRPDFHN